MLTFTAKQFHETPKLVYQAAVKEAAKITHAHHGDFIVIHESEYLNGNVSVKLPSVVHSVDVEGKIK